MLYEMLTGTRAFEGSSPLATMTAILRGKIHNLPGKALSADFSGS